MTPRPRADGHPEDPVDALATALDTAAATEPGPDRVVAALSLVVGLRAHLDELERRLIGSAREQQVTWAQLSLALGLTSRQAAEQRWLRLSATTTRDPAETRTVRQRQRLVDKQEPAVAALRRAATAAHRWLATDQTWDSRHPRAALARRSLALAVASAEPGALHHLAQRALDDLDEMAAAGVARATHVVVRDLRRAVTRRTAGPSPADANT
ncbi:hypothetical protein AWW66_00050 [Micromonospora rosaria]|uniref:HSP18 transcriptional regulator n=1 Tax=Micromonospora rosaria TaxID=47874 RepID=A0A136PZS1_9ACTN|nr:hypothetical protein [Micromonospora rosaria]KXK63887.1 hypothetical protein AWW66_00050 [Micromonospora rosaria]